MQSMAILAGRKDLISFLMVANFGIKVKDGKEQCKAKETTKHHRSHITRFCLFGFRDYFYGKRREFFLFPMILSQMPTQSLFSLSVCLNPKLVRYLDAPPTL